MTDLEKNEAARISKMGLYKHGPIFAIRIPSGEVTNVGPGHPISCDCQWCRNQE